VQRIERGHPHDALCGRIEDGGDEQVERGSRGCFVRRVEQTTHCRRCGHGDVSSLENRFVGNGDRAPVPGRLERTQNRDAGVAIARRGVCVQKRVNRSWPNDRKPRNRRFTPYIIGSAEGLDELANFCR